MSENILIKNNVFGKGVFENISKTVLETDFPWYFIQDSAFNIKIKDKKTSLNYSWYHMLYSKDNNGNNILSSYYNFFYLPVLTILDSFNLNIDKLYRLRLGLTTTIGKDVINKPHIDYQFPHKTILFYLNDSDGDTVFYKNDCKTVIKRVTPKENTAVLFNGLINHSSSKPNKNQRRIVLNINLTD